MQKVAMFSSHLEENHQFSSLKNHDFHCFSTFSMQKSDDFPPKNKITKQKYVVFCFFGLFSFFFGTIGLEQKNYVH